MGSWCRCWLLCHPSKGPTGLRGEASCLLAWMILRSAGMSMEDEIAWHMSNSGSCLRSQRKNPNAAYKLSIDRGVRHNCHLPRATKASSSFSVSSQSHSPEAPEAQEEESNTIKRSQLNSGSIQSLKLLLHNNKFWSSWHTFFYRQNYY